jgi:segregation and condensation protein B
LGKKDAKKTGHDTDQRHTRADDLEDFEFQIDFDSADDDSCTFSDQEAGISQSSTEEPLDETADSGKKIADAEPEGEVPSSSKRSDTLKVDTEQQAELLPEVTPKLEKVAEVTEKAPEVIDKSEPSLAFDDYFEMAEGELDGLKVDKTPITETPDIRETGFDFTEALTLEGMVEAIVFASEKPIKSQEIHDIISSTYIDDPDVNYQVKHVDAVLDSLFREYEQRAGGFRLEYIRGEGYHFRTAPAVGDLMEAMFSNKPRPLSRAALETLSIIAYRQPVTRADIEFVRGVDAGSIIKNLLDRDLIVCVGRKEDSGRPMLFGTTNEFLKVFRVSSLDELPPLASFQPAAETVVKALDVLEKGDLEVDVEEFIGDTDRDDPESSKGLLLEPQDEMAGQIREQDIEGSAPDQAGEDSSDSTKLRVEGAQLDLEELERPSATYSIEGANDASTKIPVTDGDSLPPRSREVDQ